MAPNEAPRQRIRPLRRLHRVATNLLHLARRKRGRSRLPLALEYLRLELRELARSHAPGRPAQRRTIFGASIEAPDCVALRQMFEEIFLLEAYCFEATRPDPLILDCGSNVGLSVLFFKRLHPAARVVAFEPDPATFAILERNVIGNGLRGVELHCAALAATEGEVTLHRDPARPGALTMTTRPGRGAQAGERVPCVRLSKWIEEPVDFVKLDVEGAELEVLEELAASGRLGAIDQMVVEYHHHFDPESDRFSRFLALLEEGGFGYQLGAAVRQRPYPRRRFQDVLVYAYRKGSGAAGAPPARESRG
jgi:FkbM family methyltransferase